LGYFPGYHYDVQEVNSYVRIDIGLTIIDQALGIIDAAVDAIFVYQKTEKIYEY